MSLRYTYAKNEPRPHALTYGHLYEARSLPATWVVEVFQWCKDSFGMESYDRWQWIPSGVAPTGRFEFVNADDALACRMRWG